MNPAGPTPRIVARATSLLPSWIAKRITGHPSSIDDVRRYDEMNDRDLLHVTEVCLRNLDRIDEDTATADADLRVLLVPELCERIEVGTRDRLRRLSSTLAEYDPDPIRPSFFVRRMLSLGNLQRLRDTAIDLRHRVEQVATLDVCSLIDRVRFALAGSRAAERYVLTDPVYEPAFTYRLVPVVALRALRRSTSSP